MTELGEAFIAALVDQGFGIVMTSDDMVVLLSDGSLHHMPRILIEEDVLVWLLEAAIAAIVMKDPRFIWPWPPQGGPRPGLN